MQSEQLFEQLKSFLENEPACRKTLSCLNKSAQIGINISQTVKCCVKVSDGNVTVLRDHCSSPDLIFHGNPEAVETLISQKGMNPGTLGVKLVKQMVAGQVTLTMPGNLFHILRKGYLDILKVGGKDFLVELKKHNLASVSKIISALKKFKQN